MLARFLRFSRRYTATLVLLVTFGCTAPLNPTTRPAIPVGEGPDAGSRVWSGAETGTVGPASQAGFYPLRVGNRWDYLRGVVVGIVPDSGEAPPLERYESVISREIVGAQALAGREYLLEQVTETGAGQPWVYVVYSRQDVTGLYEFEALRFAPRAGERADDDGVGQAPTFSWMDAAAIERLIEGRSPAERDAYLLAARRLDERIVTLRALGKTGAARVAGMRLPATAGPNELTRLRYPLEPKSLWAVRDDPNFRFVAEVIGVDVLDLPAGRFRGYRIRLGADVFGPHDVVHVWYGRSGYLQLVAHLELDAIDQTGSIIGRVIYDMRETLVDLHLAGTELVALPPWLTAPGK